MNTTTDLVRQMREALDDARDDVLDVQTRAQQMAGTPRWDARIAAQGLQLAALDAALAAADAWLAVSKTETPTTEAGLIPPAMVAKQLRHCAIAVSDWLAGGCDVHDIPRPHIAALVTWTKETLPAPSAQEPKP